LQGKVIDSRKRPDSNIVFLIDVSGSMNQSNKLPLLKKAFKMMVSQIGPQEHIAIVTYAGRAGLVLDSTPGTDKSRIYNAIDNLHAGGSTAGAAGLKLAYRIAQENFIRRGNNRIILATDGDFNVGVSSDDALVQLIEDRRDQGVFLSILGFGTGNLKDAKMEKIADKGNGNYFYLDSVSEAEKVLMNELGSTLFTIAKDVKVQVEFNPAQVAAYRLIGYENRQLAAQDFKNDRIDAGELGAGHTVTALYEIIPAEYGRTERGIDSLKYQQLDFFRNQDLMTVKLRYKEPDGHSSKLMKKVVRKGDVKNQVKGDFQFAAAVAEFGLLLRNSAYKGYASYSHLLGNARASRGEDRSGYRQEFIDLVEKARTLDYRQQGTYEPEVYYPYHQSPGMQFKGGI